MRILFAHQNFPGQFKFLAPALAALPEHEVVALAMHKQLSAVWQGVRVVPYQPKRSSTASIHPWLIDMETKIIRGEAVFHAAQALQASGFQPDVIVAHPGWGESLFLKDVWPDAQLAIYSEFFYKASDGDVGFDPEFPDPSQAVSAPRLRLKNLNNFMHFDIADAGLAPTQWQASTFPEQFRRKITVIHDGIDTVAMAPSSDAVLTFSSGLEIRAGDEVITFVNRNLEPYRGYHSFMRALPEVLRQRPNARVLIVGGDDVSYGAKPPAGQSWKEIFLSEVRDQIDLTRVHFLGMLPYAQFRTLLQVSAVHVYLTYPFVLSWSLLEAMSIGCAIIASDTAPVREAIHHDRTGRLCDFFDSGKLAEAICKLLDQPEERKRLGANARALAVKDYDLRTVCLPKQLAWVASLALAK